MGLLLLLFTSFLLDRSCEVVAWVVTFLLFLPVAVVLLAWYAAKIILVLLFGVGCPPRELEPDPKPAPPAVPEPLKLKWGE